MNEIKAYSADSASSPLAADTIPRREPTPRDVQIDILFCGVCHSDLHHARDEWKEVMPTVYPCVPGHEIVGRVTATGAEASDFQVGDLVGVGCLVDADLSCPCCQENQEQLSPSQVLTYGSPDRHGTAPVTYGGYSTSIVVDKHFVLRVPENLELAGVAPLLCAGITTYSPLKRWGTGPGKKVGIVGLGGLGHMGVKFSHAFGAHTVVFTTSPDKAEEAKKLGADEVVVSKNADEMAAQAGSFDLLLNTVAAAIPLEPYLNLLKPDATMVMVGAPEKPVPLNVFSLLFGRRAIAGSIIGGIAETQEMLDFCSERGITADVEVIPMSAINEAYERMLKGDVKYRFSIDISSLK
ncbi:MAG: NAD(P)-dependent alcohol dehydrogenase [Verrucomicrobiales bacterium]